MGRPARYIPETKTGVLVEITCRCIGGRALLVPAPNPHKFNEIVAGVLGRALEVSPLALCSAIVASNHLHLLTVVHEQQQLSRMMAHFACNVSKEIGRLRPWRGSMWERRFDAIVVSDEPDSQWSRLKYSLSHGVKEGLVESPLKWPGIHAARQLVHGEPLEGYWFNRSKEWAALNRGQKFGAYDFATQYLIHFAQLPAFRHLTPQDYQDRVAELILEIEADGERARCGDSVAGVERILSQNPFEPPTRRTKRSPRPLFHFASKNAREDLMNGFADFLAQYRVASEALLGGNLDAAGWFPAGCYPPALPFTGVPAPRRPPSPPTRAITILDSGVVERGEIPVIEIPVMLEARARGQPP